MKHKITNLQSQKSHKSQYIKYKTLTINIDVMIIKHVSNTNLKLISVKYKTQNHKPAMI